MLATAKATSIEIITTNVRTVWSYGALWISASHCAVSRWDALLVGTSAAWHRRNERTIRLAGNHGVGR